MSSLLPAVVVPAFIPSPSQGVWHLGPIPLRAYAICILIGIFAGYWLGRKRWVARGGSAEVLGDIIMWAVPFGLVGARIYHVLTDFDRYFGAGGKPVDALKIWNGGLGIWGAIAFGAFGAWIACRRHKVPFLAVADAMAPGIALAQVLGRFGNYFNQELFGRPTTQWWGLEIDRNHRPAGFEEFATFHPTFLYEALWNLGVVALVILADRRFRFGHGRAFALYVAGYTVGRAWIENLRIDEADTIAGLRLNVWTSILVFAGAVVFFALSAKLRPGREDVTGTRPTDEPSSPTTGATAGSTDPDEAPGSTADSTPDEPAEATAGPAADRTPDEGAGAVRGSTANHSPDAAADAPLGSAADRTPDEGAGPAAGSAADRTADEGAGQAAPEATRAPAGDLPSGLGDARAAAKPADSDATAEEAGERPTDQPSDRPGAEATSGSAGNSPRD